jgi:hypothetical protein
LLVYHPLNSDSIQHQCGPGSAAAGTALSYADRQVGDLLKVVQHVDDKTIDARRRSRWSLEGHAARHACQSGLQPSTEQQSRRYTSIFILRRA